MCSPHNKVTKGARPFIIMSFNKYSLVSYAVTVMVQLMVTIIIIIILIGQLTQLLIMTKASSSLCLYEKQAGPT